MYRAHKRSTHGAGTNIVVMPGSYTIMSQSKCVYEVDLKSLRHVGGPPVTAETAEDDIELLFLFRGKNRPPNLDVLNSAMSIDTDGDECFIESEDESDDEKRHVPVVPESVFDQGGPPMYTPKDMRTPDNQGIPTGYVDEDYNRLLPDHCPMPNDYKWPGPEEWEH